LSIRYTPKASASLGEIGRYVLEQTQSKAFTRQHIEKLRVSLHALLSAFPEAGVPVQIDGICCRRIVVEGYSILYMPRADEVIILLIYKQNEPKLI
jgi:plasmid stabilization system protein ParE